MAKVRETSYSFDASAKQVTLAGHDLIDLEGLLIIVNVTDQEIIYNFADTSLGGTVSGNVVTLEYVTTGMDDADNLLIYYDDGTAASNTVVKAVEAITDWTAVAQNTIAQSAVLNCASHARTLLHIQAGLDTTTAHTGTKFIVQSSSDTSGNEDWQDYTEFLGLVGTAATDLIEDNPLAAGSTGITLTSHTLTTLGKWLMIEDATLENSELVFEKSQSANAVNLLDATTNSHVSGTAIFNVCLSQSVVLDSSVYRCRVIVDNSYDADGSSLNFKIRASKLTAT